MTKPERPNEIIRLLEQLEPHVANVRHGSLTKDGTFRCVVRASLKKAFEFAVFAQKEQAEPFFLTASLRGICEDLIVLSFLSPLQDRDDIVLAVHHDGTSDAMMRQSEFFSANRPWQPVISDASDYRATSAAELKRIAKIYGWPRDRLPIVMGATGGVVECGSANGYQTLALEQPVDILKPCLTTPAS
jgi:hypothetical protein